eukprot:365208-Chlamydomonas_euryale.AAC.1
MARTVVAQWPKVRQGCVHGQAMPCQARPGLPCWACLHAMPGLPVCYAGLAMHAMPGLPVCHGGVASFRNWNVHVLYRPCKHVRGVNACMCALHAPCTPAHAHMRMHGPQANTVCVPAAGPPSSRSSTFAAGDCCMKGRWSSLSGNHRRPVTRVARDVRTGGVRRLGRTDTLPKRTGRPRRFSEKKRLPLHFPTA